MKKSVELLHRIRPDGHAEWLLTVNGRTIAYATDPTFHPVMDEVAERLRGEAEAESETPLAQSQVVSRDEALKSEPKAGSNSGRA